MWHYERLEGGERISKRCDFLQDTDEWEGTVRSKGRKAFL